jgi:CBS domain-containing protein
MASSRGKFVPKVQSSIIFAKLKQEVLAMSLPISNIMRTKVIFCEESTSLRKVSETILNENVGSILVSRGEESVGIVTINDLLRAVLKELEFDKTRAGDIMSQPLETCDCDQNLDQALKKLEETGRTRLVVKKGGKVVGILKKTMAERFKGFAGLYQFSPKTRSLPFRRGSGSTQS